MPQAMMAQHSRSMPMPPPASGSQAGPAGRSLRARLYACCAALLGRLASDTVDRCGGGLGVLAFHAGIRRRVVRDNLRLALDPHPAVRRRWARQCYASMGAQFLGLPSLRADADGRFRVQWLNPGVIAAVRRRYAAPAPVCLTLHLGNWDAIGAAFASLWGQAVVYATAQHDPHADALVNAHRQRLGMRVLFVGDRQAPVLGLRAVRGGAPLGLLADQGPPPRRGVAVRFLGQPTFGHQGPAFFAQRAGAPLIPFVCFRRRAGVYAALAGRPISLEGGETQAVQRGIDALSAIIARFPGQYFWHHRRFKYVSDAPSRAEEPWRRGLRWALGGAPD